MNKRQIAHRCSSLALFALLGCGDGSDASSSSTARSDSIIVADPNPIQVCDGSNHGQTVLSWRTTVATAIHIRIGSYDGPLLAHLGPKGTTPTGKWVTDGLEFYLQDVSAVEEPTKANTLARVEVTLTNNGCP